MKFTRIPALALAATLAACAHESRPVHQPAPVAATESRPAGSNLPPSYLGPGYAAAAVYGALPRQRVVPN